MRDPLFPLQSRHAICASRRRELLVMGFLAACAAVSIVLAGAVGSIALSVPELLGALRDLMSANSTGLATSLLELRLSRALTGFATGAIMTMSGVMMQALLHNLLADPYVLGVSGGTSVGALATMLLLPAAWMVDLAAFGENQYRKCAIARERAVCRQTRAFLNETNDPLVLRNAHTTPFDCRSFLVEMISVSLIGQPKIRYVTVVSRSVSTEIRATAHTVTGMKGVKHRLKTGISAQARCEC